MGKAPLRITQLGAGCDDAQTREPRLCIPNSVDPAESPTRPIGGLRGFKETASATLLEPAFAHERDDASRLAQRCYLRPHSTRLLLNSILRLRPSSLRSLTSLHFCCAGWAPTRGRELSGERPRTLI